MPERDATRGQKTTMALQHGRAKTFCLCVKSSFQDDYQSSCGLTWGDIIADSAILCAQFRRLSPAVPPRDTSRQMVTRNSAARMTAESSDFRFDRGDHAFDTGLNLGYGVAGNAECGGDFADRAVLKGIRAIHGF